MIVYTDNKKLGRKYFNENKWYNCNVGFQNPEIRDLLTEIFTVDDIFTAEISINSKLWKYAFIVDSAEKSQYDLLINLAQEITLPDGILCFADSGKNFHGFHSRSWSAERGNIHLSAFLKPNKDILNFASGFLVLSANSVIQSIDMIPELKDKALVKWVNDIIIDNAKISGVLAHTHAQGNKIKDVVLGIGVNVLNKPQIEPTQFVPKVCCLNEFAEFKDYDFAIFIDNLINNISENYHNIIDNNHKQLVDYYIKCSMVIGKQVSIWSDMPDRKEKIFTGIVERIGENLELYLENNSKPITSGRLSID